MKEFSHRLKILRKKNDITQYELAENLKVSRNRITSYEAEGKEPCFQFLCVLADYFNVTTDYLLGRKEGNAMPLAEKIEYTVEDIYALPDGERAELVDGKLYMMAPPNRSHQKILMELSSLINVYIKGKGGPCEVYPAPFAVFLTKGNKTYVEPDISVICDKNKLDEKGCHGAPDWIIEIVSPGSKTMDNMTKLWLYRAAGVREYWIVDPSLNLIKVYYLEANQYADYKFQDTIKVNIYDDFSINFSGILPD